MIDEVNRAVAMLSIPCAVIGLFTGNMWWLAPIVYVAFLAGRAWLLRRRMPREYKIDHTALHEKIGAVQTAGHTFTISDTPTDADRDAILAALAAFNAQNGYPADARPVAILLHDGNGHTVGGLWGRTIYGWMYVDYLVVPENMRGAKVGTKLMASAEAIATARGCAGSWLTTFTFQAQGFYEKLGYSVFAKLDNSPGDNVRIFMQKRLQP